MAASGQTMMKLLNRRQDEKPRFSPRDRSLALTVLMGLGLLMILGLIYSVAQGSQRITTSAGALHDADESLRAATVARAQVALATHMAAVDRQFGTNSSDPMRVSITEAEVALTDLATGVELLAEAGVNNADELHEAATDFAGRSEAILGLLITGEIESAQEMAAGRLDNSFDELTSVLVGIRDDLSETVRASDQLLSRVGDIARFLVAFLIPAAVILIYRELTRRQQRQAELETRLEAERRINVGREEFIANASHELRTPLTSIIGMSALLGENEALREDPMTAELLATIMGESEDLARMVEDLLTTARLDAGALRYVFEDVEIHREVKEMAEPLVQGGLDLRLDCESAVVHTDRLRTRQVLRNLLSNARKYGGERLRIVGRIEGRTYLCSVIDDGPGIPEELESRLFERFIHQGHQTATKDSVGLGLSIVHALTQGMGGSIRYERIEGETHFQVRLPLSDHVHTPAEMLHQLAGGTEPESPTRVPQPETG